MAAKYVEAVLGAADTFTAGMDFRGRVTALVEKTSPSWSGTVVLQRRYKKPSGEWSDWMTVAAIEVPSANAFIEHEEDVEFRLGTLTGLTGATPLARLSQ